MNAAERLLEGRGAGPRDRAALVCGDETVSVEQLAERTRRSAGALTRLGVRPGDRVLLLMRDTPEFAAAWLGVLRAGAVAVALNHKLGDAEYRHILADSGARLAVVEDIFAVARPDLTAELAREGRLSVAGGKALGHSDWREAVRDAPAGPAFGAGPQSPAFMLYSSGTTGMPKGIVHSHGAVLQAGAACRRFGLGEGDRVFATSKFFFAYGLEHGLIAPLALGATSILSADWPTAQSVAALVAAHRPAALFSVPTMYRRLLAEVPERLADFSCVRRFVSAGEHLSAQLVQQWRSATGGELLNLYGMSETFCAAMVTPPGTSDGVRTGLPLEGVQVRLADPESGADAQAGVLWIKHPAQASGYSNLPERTAAQFKDGWFRTGDLFIRDADGYFVYEGRADDLVKIAGQWVRPGELEDAVAGLAQVAEAACVSGPDDDGLDRLALFVAPRGAADAALQCALAACEEYLPRHKRPKWLRAVDELPRTATGKVQRFKLRELLRQELSGKR